ncbi:MAG: hypothetical protein PHV68_05695 [Candidatus Gastranaerophilales bacterium]|nr:hypothetical protein [Candidatus Gastranaerophilales bacterium]
MAKLAIQPNTIPKAKCPHGNPIGACPMCAGMSGGGSKSTKIKPNEMSWDECYAIGQFLKNLKIRAELNDQAFEKSLANTLNQQKIEVNFAQKIANLNNLIQTKLSDIAAQRPILNIITKPLQFVANIISKLTNFIQNTAVKINNFIQETISKFANISDKLAAIFGEQKNAIEKFISDNFGKVRKKIFSFFEMIDAQMQQGDQQDDKEKDWLEKLRHKISKFILPWEKIEGEKLLNNTEEII